MSAKLTAIQKSALAETGNIGSGHAAIALSEIIDKKIMISSSSIKIFELSKLKQILKKKSANITQISVNLLGDAEGIMIFVLGEDRAEILCDIVMERPVNTTKAIGDIEKSALKEIGNIICSAYLCAINKMTGLSLFLSSPDFNNCNIDHLNKYLADNNSIKEVLCVKTEFVESISKIEGIIFFLPLDDAVKKILDALGV